MTHNIRPEWLSVVEPDLFRVKFTDAGYDYFWMAAKARVQAKIDNGSMRRRFDRGISEQDAIEKCSSDYWTSIQGEAAFATVYDQEMNWDVLTHGDPGFDFHVGQYYIDVKTTTHEHGVLNLHNQEYIDTISNKAFAGALALVLVTRPVDPVGGRAKNRDQWITVRGWLSWSEAVKLAVDGEKGGSPMIYVEQSKLWKPSELAAVLKP